MFLIRQDAGTIKLTGSNWDTKDGDGSPKERAPAAFQFALSGLETAILDACVAETEWPAQISAGICAGIDMAIANPAMIGALTVDASAKGDCRDRYERLIGRLAGFVRVKAPASPRSPGTDEAMVAGIVGLVGDHIRIGRLERLAELRPELVLMALLPYLGFAEAQRWANRLEQPPRGRA